LTVLRIDFKSLVFCAEELFFLEWLGLELKSGLRRGILRNMIASQI